MYKYQDMSNVGIGSVVERKPDKGDKKRIPPGSLHIVTDVLSNGDLCLNANSKMTRNKHCFNLLVTAPGSTAKPGDTCIRIKHTTYSSLLIGETVLVTEAYAKNLCWGKDKIALMSHFLVLCEEEPKTSKNPFCKGDRIRRIANGHTSCMIGTEYIVYSTDDDQVYYADGYASHYSNWELVHSAAPTTNPCQEIPIPPDAWRLHKHLYTDTSVPAYDKQVVESAAAQLNKKETRMEQVTIQIPASSLVQSAPAVETKTDYELTKKIVAETFSSKGKLLFKEYFTSVAKAKKSLQQPERLGMTIKVYELKATCTTDIPLVEVK